MIKETIFLILFCLACFVSMAQIGGRYAFESSSLPVNARITALGGSHITVMDSDVGLAFQNPALSNVSMHNQLGINHNSHFAGIGNGNVAMAMGLIRWA